MAKRTRAEVTWALVRAWRSARLQTDLFDDAAFAKLGINRTDGRSLDVLSAGPLPASALASACGVTANAMTTVIDRLTEKGLVERQPDPADRRRVLVALTPLADYVSAQLYGPVLDWSLQNFARYTVAELALLERFLTEGQAFQARHIEHIRELELSWSPPE